MQSRAWHPPDSQRTGERRRRLRFAVLLAGVTLAQTVMVLRAVQQDFTGLGLQAAIGAAVTAALACALSLRRASWHTMERVGLTAGYLWLVTSTILVGRGEVESNTVYIGSLVMATFAFMWLPSRIAILLAALGYASLWLPLMGRPDVPALLALAVVTSQLWYLGAHGRVVQQERVRNDLLAQVAYTDPLTGLLNRRSTAERLDELLATTAAGTEGVALVLLDIDHFKRINDQLGHLRGDEVLVAVAASLKSHGHQVVVASRWGGEEFLVVCAAPSRDAAVGTAQEVLARVRAMTLPGLPRVTVSGGLATFDEGLSVMELLGLADARMYQAKARGRDQLVSEDTPVGRSASCQSEQSSEMLKPDTTSESNRTST